MPTADANTVSRLFLERVASTPEARAFSSFAKGAWNDFTWRDYGAMARAFGLGLTTLGVKRGDVVAILGQTRHEWVVSDIGALGIGAVTVGLYPTLAPRGIGSMQYVLEHSEAKILVVESAATFAEKIAPIASGLTHVEHIVVWDDAEGARALDPRVIALADVVARGASMHASDEAAWRRAGEATRPDDLALLVYTSGTTGQPKGAMITHANIVTMIAAAEQVLVVNERESTVSFLPLAHIAERCLGHHCRIKTGASTHFARGLETLLEDIGQAKPTFFGSVPRIFEKVYAGVMGEVAKLDAAAQQMTRAAIAAGVQAAKARRAGEEPDDRTKALAAAFDARLGAMVRARFGGRCKWFTTGAAPTAVEILDFFDACGLPVYECYGLTESTSLVTANREGAVRLGSVGQAIPGVELRIADDGEILARGPNIFSGYFKEPAATAECLMSGWFHTGDIGRLDADGFLTITDRKKNILITAGGKNITPSNIENEVKNDPLISYCHMHANRRPYPTALVCLDPERLAAIARASGLAGSSAAELRGDTIVVAAVQAAIDRANGAFARYEQIRKFAILPRELSIEDGELTPTLKVKRNEVDAKYAAVIEAMYSGGD
jgi:long-chain acyl-CoA synthetase